MSTSGPSSPEANAPLAPTAIAAPITPARGSGGGYSCFRCPPCDDDDDDTCSCLPERAGTGHQRWGGTPSSSSSCRKPSSTSSSVVRSLVAVVCGLAALRETAILIGGGAVPLWGDNAGGRGLDTRGRSTVKLRAPQHPPLGSVTSSSSSSLTGRNNASVPPPAPGLYQLEVAVNGSTNRTRGRGDDHNNVGSTGRDISAPPPPPPPPPPPLDDQQQQHSGQREWRPAAASNRTNNQSIAIGIGIDDSRMRPPPPGGAATAGRADNAVALPANTSTTTTIATGGFYSSARRDRSGSSIKDMIQALGYGYVHNRTYLGACYFEEMTDDAPRRQADKVALIEALGLQHVLRFACPPSSSSLNYTVIARPTYRDDRSSIRNVDYLNWLRLQAHMGGLRRPLIDDLTTTSEYSLWAVVHIRRGDVDPCAYPDRYLPNSYYVDAVRKYIPMDVPIVVYSESASFEPFDESFVAALQGGDDDENATTTKRNVTLRLDTDRTEVWRAIATASHVIMSRSSFSYVPTLLNGNASVIVCPSKLKAFPLQSWTQVDRTIEERSDRIASKLVANRCESYVSVRTGKSFYNVSRSE